MKKFKKILTFVLPIFLLALIYIVPKQVYAASTAYSISTDFSQYTPNSTIKISYSGVSTKDWIGIYKQGTTPSSAAADAAYAWKYTSGASGTLSFTPNDFITAQYSPNKGNTLQPGNYKAVLLKNDGYTVAAQVNFTVIEDKLLYSFEVLSDMHISTKDTTFNSHLNSALKDIKNFAKNSSCIVANGDSVDEWSWDTYSLLRDTMYSNRVGLPYVYFNLGNHELMEDSHNANVNSASFQDEFNRYLYFANDINYNMNNSTNTSITHDKQTLPYYKQTVNGQHFIFLGSESDSDRDKAYLSDTQLNWLDEELYKVAKYENDQPVFVFLHQGLNNTVAGTKSGQDWGGVIQDSQLRFILNKYPNVIYFSGHSHWQLESQSTMYQDTATYGPTLGATMFNSASVGYLWSDAGSSINGSQGLHVEVYKDKVLVKGRNYLNQSWIPSAQFTVDMNAKYTSMHKYTY
ncbi:metallophosphoesterase [Clostridium sp. YIM B02505]|uniref:Metallophosphoesterase n=1 Tax=Clostridium yunnanense TaxID=2800325 RepID=A0ABS1EIC9_9CLOT|nr:metallophosphoesterase [Clostridium yunnanense]MBK1809103.1 metallophosphoesterase [Clostridium yunnanense]